MIIKTRPLLTVNLVEIIINPMYKYNMQFFKQICRCLQREPTNDYIFIDVYAYLKRRGRFIYY